MLGSALGLGRLGEGRLGEDVGDGRPGGELDGGELDGGELEGGELEGGELGGGELDGGEEDGGVGMLMGGGVELEGDLQADNKNKPIKSTIGNNFLFPFTSISIFSSLISCRLRL